MKLKGEVSICRSSDGTIKIEVRDSVARTELVEVSISPERFGYAVTGLSSQECMLGVGNLSRIGKTKEHKEEKVLFVRDPNTDEETAKKKAKEILKQFEVDGWIGNTDDLFNQHRLNKDKTHTVHFVRWV